MVIGRAKIKWAVLGVGVLSLVSLIAHLLIAQYSRSDLGLYSALSRFPDDLSVGFQGVRDRRLWRNVKSLEPLQPYANPRTKYPVPKEHNNGFIYAKVLGGFEKIRTSICDLVTIARLLNATLVIPEIQESTNSKGISSKFKSFSYVYNEEQFMAALRNDVNIVKSLPPQLKEARKRKQYKTFKPTNLASPEFYTSVVFQALKKAKVVGLVLTDGGCLQPTLPPSLDEYQRLRCRVAFHALQFRPEILVLGHKMVERLRASGQPYLAYHPGLVRDSLAYHGCAELFEDVHSELIQYRRGQMIKQGILKEELSVDSFARKANGSCPLSPEEIGLLFRAIGYHPTTRIYLAGTETFGGQRAMIPLRAMYTNVVDRTSLCSKQEIDSIIGPETPIPPEPLERPPAKSAQELKEEWDKAGPRPRPLPPPPQRPFYQHEKEGWYGWVTEKDVEPNPSPVDLRNQAHRLLWAALDYIVSVEADAFFPGFDNDGSGWPDFSGLVMGHRLYEMASSRTYRPDRKYLAGLFTNISDHLYSPRRNWTLSVRDHLNKSLGAEGLLRNTNRSKPFLTNPIPQCSCVNPSSKDVFKGSDLQFLYSGVVECPTWMHHSFRASVLPETSANYNETEDDEIEFYGLPDDEGDNSTDSNPSSSSSEQDEEMDPDD